MGEGDKEYRVYLCAKITDEILVEAKNRYEAEEEAKAIFLDGLTGEQSINLIKPSLEVEEVEQVG